MTRTVLTLPLNSKPTDFLFQFAKLARDLVIPGGMRTKQRQNTSGVNSENAVTQEGGGASGGGGPTQLDDEELEGGLL